MLLLLEDEPIQLILSFILTFGYLMADADTVYLIWDIFIATCQFSNSTMN